MRFVRLAARAEEAFGEFWARATRLREEERELLGLASELARVMREGCLYGRAPERASRAAASFAEEARGYDGTFEAFERLLEGYARLERALSWALAECGWREEGARRRGGELYEAVLRAARRLMWAVVSGKGY